MVGRGVDDPGREKMVSGSGRWGRRREVGKGDEWEGDGAMEFKNLGTVAKGIWGMWGYGTTGGSL